MPNISYEELVRFFPFGIVIDQNGLLLCIGKSMQKCIGEPEGKKLQEHFHVVRPASRSLDFENLCKMEGKALVLSHISGLLFQTQAYVLRGQSSIFLACSLNINGFEAIREKGFSLSDFPAWERTLDYVMLLDARNSEKTSRIDAIKMAESMSQIAALSEKTAMEAMKVNERQRLLLNARSGFLRIVSHEMRTPMHVISGCVSLIEAIQGDTISKGLQTPLNLLKTVAKKMVDMIDSATGILGLMSEDVGMNLEYVPLHPMLLKAFRGRHSEEDLVRSGKVKLDLDQNMHNVYIDKIWMEKAFYCLRELAATATARGGVARLKCYLDTEDCPCVELSGDYVDASVPSHHLFGDPFQVTDDSLQHGDNGMGLNVALVQNVMSAHHGETLLMPNPDGSSRILLRFAKRAGDSGLDSTFVAATVVK